MPCHDAPASGRAFFYGTLAFLTSLGYHDDIMSTLNLTKSTRKFIRLEKARIRRQFFDVKKQEELISELYKRFLAPTTAAPVKEAAKPVAVKPAKKVAAKPKKKVTAKAK